MTTYHPDTLRQLLADDECNITLADELESAIAHTIGKFIGDKNLAVFALANDVMPALVNKLESLDLNAYCTEVEPPHTAEDSLTFLDREAAGLLEAADEEIHGVSTLSMVDTPDLPDHVQDAVSMIQTAIKLIRMEAGLHGARNKTTYSTGAPTSEVRQEPGREPQDDGTTRLVMHDVHYGLYPDGHHNHPAFR